MLRGIFTLRRSELAWYYQDGASHLFPDRWEEFVAPIPVAERHDFITAYRKRLVNDNDKAEQLKCAEAWMQWENTTSGLYPTSPEVETGGGSGEDEQGAAAYALAFARIENHYFHHGGWFEWDDWVLDNLPKIRHIPTFVVQGRYDVVCPPRTAWELHRRFPEAHFVMVKDSGHSSAISRGVSSSSYANMEPGSISELVQATERFKSDDAGVDGTGAPDTLGGLRKFLTGNSGGGGGVQPSRDTAIETAKRGWFSSWGGEKA